MGISDLKVVAPSTDFLWQLLGFQGIKRLWDGLLAVDWLIKTACSRRPYEKQKGAIDQVHQTNLRDIELSLAIEDLSSALKRCAARLREIPISPEPRPKIGLAGDIYTRQNPVANHNLFLKLEAMGCEVWPSPFIIDNVDFGIQKEFFINLRRRNFLKAMTAGLLHLRKELERFKIEKSLKDVLPSHKEPSFRQIETLISPYLTLDNNQTLILNIAKMVDFASRGADGVINAICFNCMLGTVSGAIAQKIRQDFQNIPIPTLIFKGKEDPTEESRLEAFVYQVKQSWEKKQLKQRELTRRPWVEW
jgi:predicted nucleotide-binding protein (sugar kinase/HSP70/actin superfamily)